MVISSYASEDLGYGTGYNCDKCGESSAQGHRNGSRERWFCFNCIEDFCFTCVPEK